MKIAILGFAGQGQSAYEYWRQQGDNELCICDLNTSLQIPDGVESQLGDNYLKNLDRFDLLIRTPALHPQDIIDANSPAVAMKITSVTNEFFKVCPTKNIIGVTGTKGKGTTSTLITKMLEAAGYRVHLGGNIGTPPLDMLKEGIKPEDWVVLELANFQLIDLKYSPAIGVCLMVVPEHLNWHKDFDEYITAKQQLFIHQSPDDIAIYYGKNATSKKIGLVGIGNKIPYYVQPGAYIEDGFVAIAGQMICKTDEIKLLGKHNWQNVCAAITAVWQITQNIIACRMVATTFEGMEHRLEFVREHKGIKYYNDSFGTTPETAIVAIEAFSQPKVVILGGSDKGADFSELAKAVVTNNVRRVIAIGDTAEAIVEKIDELKNIHCVEWTVWSNGQVTMEEIVQAATKHAEPGDVVLLSTACASFGLFKNYKDRGEQFKKVVLALA